MKISRLNIAVFIQLAGLLLFLLVRHPAIRIAGIAIIVVGGVLYRREQKRLKAEASSQVPPVA